MPKTSTLLKKMGNNCKVNCAFLIKSNTANADCQRKLFKYHTQMVKRSEIIKNIDRMSEKQVYTIGIKPFKPKLFFI